MPGVPFRNFLLKRVIWALCPLLAMEAPVGASDRPIEGRGSLKRILVALASLLFLASMLAAPSLGAGDEDTDAGQLDVELTKDPSLYDDPDEEGASIEIDPPVVAFSGGGEATALDLAMPALNQLSPSLAASFPGVTLGRTETDFSSLPGKKASVSGRAAGRCNLMSPSADTLKSCSSSGGTIESSDLNNPGDSAKTCSQTARVPESGAVVVLESSCGMSHSELKDGLPRSVNEAGVATTHISLDLTALSPLSEWAKDEIVRTLQSFINYTFEVIKLNIPQGRQDELQTALNEHLSAVSEGTKAGTIKAGASSSIVESTADSVSVTSQAAGAVIGLLGITDPLVDGLIIIDVSAGKATASWDGWDSLATAQAEPAIATLRIRDLLNGGYVEVPVSADQLAQGLGILDAVSLLDTDIKLAEASGPVEGRNVSASASGVEIHALKGLGDDPKTPEKDGGIIFRLASASVNMGTDLSLAGRFNEILPELPMTGGPTSLFILASILLAAAAMVTFKASRKLVRI